MSKYTQSAAPNMVLSDGVLTDATAECNRLHKDNLRHLKLISALRSEAVHVLLHAQAMRNRLNPKVEPGK